VAIAAVSSLVLGILIGAAWRLYAKRPPNTYYAYLPTTRADAYREVQGLGAALRMPFACPPEFQLPPAPPGTFFPKIDVDAEHVGECFTAPPRRWLTVSLRGDDASYVYEVYGDSRGPVSDDEKRLLARATATAAGGLPENIINKIVASAGGGSEGDTFVTDRVEANVTRREDGGWTISIVAVDHQAWVRFISKPQRIDPERLARNFASVFHFARGEAFKPLAIDALRRRAELCEKTKPTKKKDARVIPSTCDLLDEFPSETPCGTTACGREWILDLDPDESDAQGYRAIEQEIRDGTFSQPVVYWHLADVGFRRELVYWVYYLFNNFANVHEGDWESVQVDLAGGRDKDTIGVARWFYSSHGGGDTRSCARLTSDCRHVDVYVARGSHANYFDPGPHDAAAACLGQHCVQSPRPDETERSEDPLEPGDYKLVELKEPPYMGRYGRANLKAGWLRDVPIPKGWWRPNAPEDPRIRNEWLRTPLAPFEAAVGDEPPASSWIEVWLDD
jgi:hypothetical protein